MGGISTPNSPRVIGSAVLSVDMTAGVITAVTSGTYHGLSLQGVSAGVITLNILQPRPDVGYMTIVSQINSVGTVIFPSGGRTVNTVPISSSGAFTGSTTLNVALVDA